MKRHIYALTICGRYAVPKRRCLTASRYGTLAILLALTLSSCTTQRQIDAANQKGALSGQSDGWEAGEAKGFREASDKYQSQAFRKTLWTKYWEGDFQRPRLWRWGTIALGIIAGLALQWGAFCGLRGFRYLLDVDFILTKRSSKVANSLILAACLLSSQGCEHPAKKAWKSGYDRAYQSAFQEGFSHGTAEGQGEGTKRGVEKAQAAARTGRSSWLYLDLAGCGLGVGLTMGIAVQYLTLFVMRRSEHVNEFWSPLLVPGIAASPSYGLVLAQQEELLHYRESILSIKQRLRKSFVEMTTRANRKNAELANKSQRFEQSMRDGVRKVEPQIATIIRKAESTVGRNKHPDQLLTTCPQCRVRVRYRPDWAGRSGRCGSCGNAMRLPGKRD